MSHYDKQEWMKYVAGTLQEKKLSELEDHLLTCDDCMIVYMECVEDDKNWIPLLQNPGQFANIIMENLPSFNKDPIKTITRKRKFYETPFFHYGVAAAFTLVFMGSGFFTDILDFINLFQAESISQNSAPFSNSIMDKTVNLLDVFK